MDAQSKITSIITDLDGCLWEGILAERQELHINHAYLDCLINYHNLGIQIFVVSKNDYDAVEQQFKLLGIETNLFTSVIANWEPKYLNIERLLAQTKIRASTVIFIDDNAFEISEVKTALPDINCTIFSQWKNVLSGGYLIGLKETVGSEVEQRKNRYRTAISSSSINHSIQQNPVFLRSLKRKMSLSEVSLHKDLDRFANLLSSTHRINFNPEKFKGSDHAKTSLKEQMDNGDKLFAVNVWENDLPLGLSGGFVVSLAEDIAYVRDATFSCGIIGRDFEQRSLIELLERLRGAEVKKIFFTVTHTSTNIRVTEVLRELGFVGAISVDGILTFELDLLAYKPPKDYDWIEVIDDPTISENSGIASVVSFFDHEILPQISRKSTVLNLGAGYGEVLGFLQQERKKSFYDLVSKLEVEYKKVDVESIPGEEHILASADDLRGIFDDNYFDIVMAIELLEHAKYFWEVINEMIRVCRVNGYIFITTPGASYPKHEYPIDLWRIGASTLMSFFPEDHFELIKLEKEGDPVLPWRILLLVRKIKPVKTTCTRPVNGMINWKSGITIFE